MSGGPKRQIPEPVSQPEDASILWAIAEGTASKTGEAFFQSLARHLAVATGTRFAFVAEFLPPRRARTLAFWARDHIVDNVEWDLRGSPCEEVIRGELCHHATGVVGRFPTDEMVVKLGIVSYLGVPLLDVSGETMGHLAVMDDRPMESEPRRLAAFRIFAARAAAEQQRLRVERQHRALERSYRDLYEEAPIAYISEDPRSRFVRANRAARELLGLRPDEVTDTLSTSLLEQIPENAQRVDQAIKAMTKEGKESASVELELRRLDNGQPVWVQWWSRVEPEGKHTRTMLVDVTERVLMSREKAHLEEQNVYLQEEIKSVHNFEEIVGQSPALLEVLENVNRVAPTNASVLITGETGTGKELIARAIHSSSQRRNKPLIKVNCAALPTGLVESELFGHERGAFSGAIKRRIGRFELAHGGTIFLDEIGDIAPEVQVKLLRVLQEKEFERIGGNAVINSDVRVIAATNRDLRRAITEGEFREDLFYRLAVFPLMLPPLRERQTDIPLLVQFILDRFSARVGKKIRNVSKTTMDLLVAYAWPGNVRELENILERAVILNPGETLEIAPELLPPTPGNDPAGGTSSTSLKGVELEHILATLEAANWVIEGAGGAAKILDIHPNTLRSRLKRLGIERPRNADRDHDEQV